MDSAVRFEALAVRQGEIEQNDIHFVGCGAQRLQRLFQRFGHLDRELAGEALVQCLAYQASITGVVFDQKDAGSLNYHISSLRGQLDDFYPELLNSLDDL